MRQFLRTPLVENSCDMNSNNSQPQPFIWYAIAGMVLVFTLLAFQLLVRSKAFTPYGTKLDLSVFENKKLPTTLPVKDTDPWTGSSSTNAVTITIYGDMTDLSTRSIEPAVVAILTELPDTRIVWKDLVIGSDRPDALLAAVGGRCAHDQKVFWQFRSLILASTGNLTANRIQEYARTAGANVGAFNACLENSTIAQAVQSDSSAALNANIIMAPTVFVDGKWIEKDLSANVLRWEVLKAQVKK